MCVSAREETREERHVVRLALDGVGEHDVGAGDEGRGGGVREGGREGAGEEGCERGLFDAEDDVSGLESRVSLCARLFNGQRRVSAVDASAPSGGRQRTRHAPRCSRPWERLGGPRVGRGRARRQR